MTRKRYENQNENCRKCHGGGKSPAGIIFGIVSFAITMAFKVVELVFQIFFGLLSGIGSASRKSHTAKGSDNEPAAAKTEERENNGVKDNVREFRNASNAKVKRAAPETSNENKQNEAGNKDFYVLLFILTIIPLIVTLAMGKLLHAGIIGAAGFGIMLAAGVISAIADRYKRKAAKQEKEDGKEEQDESDSTDTLVKDAFEKLFAIKKDIGKIKDADVRARIETICLTGEKIIGEVRTNPEGLTHVRKFFYYYLDAFREIVKKYLRLSSFEESSDEIGELVAETERSFADIEKIFRDLCEKLLEKDMMNLKAEINVIKNSN